jgi:signal transduction histidine kinase
MNPIAPLVNLTRSVAFRLAFSYGATVVLCMLLVLLALYVQTIGVLQSRIDRQLGAASHRLVTRYTEQGPERIVRDIAEALGDGVNSDTESYLLAGPDGRRIAGNLAVTPDLLKPTYGIIDKYVLRDGRPSHARLSASQLPDGAILVVGRDMQDQQDFEQLVKNAMGAGAALSVLLAIGGAIAFRHQLERRVAAIRLTTARIEAGDLSQRIPGADAGDEFARLAHDINLMLDRIESLMDGVRHVSNTIAHNLRTPLSRIRARLEEASQASAAPGQAATAMLFAIRRIEELTQVFDKLMQIAEAESGARRQAFVPVRLADIVADVVDLYAPVAEEKSVRLEMRLEHAAVALGDRDLLASAVANLVDNAIKYVTSPAQVTVSTAVTESEAVISVQDNGPGIQEIERSRVGQRFYRLDRRVPGYGLGLASVTAIAHLHHASLQLDDAAPGLVARLSMPRWVGDGFTDA